MSVETPTDSSPVAAGAGGRRAIFRMVLIGAVLVALATAFYFSPVRPWLQDTDAVRRKLATMGWWAYPACVLGVAVLVGCGAPRLLFAAVGAMVLGLWLGLLLTQLGALIGYYGVFCFVRWGGGDWVLARWPRVARWAELLRGQGVLGVVLVRQIPIHGTLLNMCLGLSGVKHRHFLIGSAIGLIPEAVPVGLVGAGLAQSSLKQSAAYLGLAFVAFVVVGVICARALRKWKQTREGAELINEVTSSEGASK